MTYFIEQLPDLMRLINEPDGEHAPFDIDAVLDALEYGWQRGPKTIPFDRAHQSRKMKRCLIEVHRFRGIVALPHQLNHSVRDAVDAFEAAIKAVIKARKAYDTTVQQMILLSALAGLDDEELEGLREAMSVVPAIEEELRDCLGDLYSVLARQPKRKRGGQPDRAQIPWQVVSVLAEYFVEGTGIPVSSHEDGPFVGFIVAFTNVPSSTVAKSVKRWRSNILVARTEGK